MAGESALGELKAVFKQENQPRNTQLRIIRICGQIGGQQAIQFLFNRKDFPDPQIRHQIFKAINRCRYRAKGRKAKQQVLATVRREVDDATWVLTCLEDMHQLSDQSLLIRSFNLELNQIRERLFLLFAMLYPPSVIMRLKAIYFSDQAENRAYALEVAENFVSKEVKDFVLFLFDDISNEQRFKRLSVTFPHSSLEYNDRLSTIIIGNHKQTSFWTRCCALYEVGLSRNSACYTAVVAALNSSDPIVCETAIWTLGKLNFNREDLIVLLEPLTLSKQINVAAMARFTLDTVALGTLSTRSPYLKRAGHHEIELIVAILLNAKEHRSRRCHAAKLLSCQHSQRAYSSLLQALLVKDRIVLMAVLNALRLGNFDRTAQIRKELLQILDEELAGVEQTQQALKTFRSTSDFQQLTHALEQEIDSHRERVLQILSLLETPSLYERVAYWYQPGINQPLPARCRSQVRTVCERLPSPTQRDKVLVLLKLSQFDSLPPSINQESSKEIIEQQLATLAFETSYWIRPWIRACALEKIGTLGLSQYTGHITKLLSNGDDIVRETAIWSLFKLAPTLCRQHLTDLRQDASPLVAQAANKLAKKLCS
jgi:HEAT repeat protein